MTRTSEFSAAGIGALCLLSTLTWLSMSGLPYEVSLLEKEYFLNDAAAGAVASLEMLALAVVVALGSKALAGLSKRHVALAGVLVALAAALSSIFIHGLVALVISRVLFGVGVGFVAISCNALPAAYERPERLFAYMQLAVGVLFVVLMYVQPHVDNAVPRSGLFVTQLACIVLFGPMALLLPTVEASQSKSSGDETGFGLPLVLVLAGLAILCVVVGGTWSFTAQAGADLGLSVDTVAWSLTGSALVGNLGPLAAALIGLRYGYAWPLSIGNALIALCVLLIYIAGQPVAYILGILALNAVPPFINPYAFGLLADRDATGVSASLGAAAVNFGLGAGPLICGYLVHKLAEGGFGIVLIALTLVAGALVLAALALLHRGHALTGAPNGPMSNALTENY